MVPSLCAVILLHALFSALALMIVDSTADDDVNFGTVMIMPSPYIIRVITFRTRCVWQIIHNTCEVTSYACNIVVGKETLWEEEVWVLMGSLLKWTLEK